MKCLDSIRTDSFMVYDTWFIDNVMFDGVDEEIYDLFFKQIRHKLNICKGEQNIKSVKFFGVTDEVLKEFISNLVKIEDTDFVIVEVVYSDLKRVGYIIDALEFCKIVAKEM